jgi:hypothetical protein
LEELAPVLVPKATVNKNDGTVFREDKIGASGQATLVKSIPKSLCEQTPANHELRLRVLAANTRHAVTTLLC